MALCIFRPFVTLVRISVDQLKILEATLAQSCKHVVHIIAYLYLYQTTAAVTEINGRVYVSVSLDEMG